MNVKRFGSSLACALALAILAMASFNASAQAYPTAPVKLIYPFPAGSAFDTASRILAAGASGPLGQPVVVENRPGAAGRLGLTAMTQTPGDAHTLAVVVNNILVILPLADPGFTFQEGKDYTLVTLALESYGVLVGRPGLPYNDVKSLISYAKANSGKINIASSGTGSAGHLVMELLQSAAGISVTHIPYKGETPAFADMLGGQVDLMFTTAGAKPQVDTGKLVALATTGPKRWGLFANLPTLIESGLPGVIYAPWLGIAAPGGTPAPVIARLNAAFRTALQSPDARQKLGALGFEFVGGTPEEFTERVRAERALWGPVIKNAGIKFN
jgi:tripartite-type tricarboxylate transporter receptor subunit TctC